MKKLPNDRCSIFFAFDNLKFAISFQDSKFEHGLIGHVSMICKHRSEAKILRRFTQVLIEKSPVDHWWFTFYRLRCMTLNLITFLDATVFEPIYFTQFNYQFEKFKYTLQSKWPWSFFKLIYVPTQNICLLQKRIFWLQRSMNSAVRSIVPCMLQFSNAQFL